MRTEFLKAQCKLVDEVARWLADKVRVLPSGAKSLEHIAVVMPTRQAMRQLKLALAGLFAGRGVIPPYILLPAQAVRPQEVCLKSAFPELVVDGAAPVVASDAEVAAAMVAFLARNKRSDWSNLFPSAADGDAGDAGIGALSLADQFKEIWDALGTNGLVMADVTKCERASTVLKGAVGEEITRWEELADFESRFFSFLNDEYKRLHPSQAKQVGSVYPELMRRLKGEDSDATIEEIVLPALADPIPAFTRALDLILEKRSDIEISVLIHADAKDGARFDEYGRPRIDAWTGDGAPVIDIPDGDIILAKKSSDLVKSLANFFPMASEDKEPPALGLADESLFPEIEAAFIERGVVNIYNPERHKLSASSLGRLAINLYSILTDEPPSFSLFAQLLRENDVIEAICRKGDGSIARGDVLSELVDYMNEFIPLDFPKHIDKERYPSLAFAFSVVEGWFGGDATSAIDVIVSVLGDIYSGRMIGNKPGDKEFVAASTALSAVIGEMRSPVVDSLNVQNRAAIFNKLITKATYQLEPESTDVLKTEGWLELAWSDADNIAIVGMSEGKVPDSIVGHAFLPDSLRAALGIASNNQRLARDAYLFSELLASHDRGAVKAFVSLTNGGGDALRPSRLLFMCSKDRLPARALRLFGECDASLSTPPRVMPENWVLNLEKEIKNPERYSASLLDSYIKCPFTYYLSNVLGMRHEGIKTELGADDFGTFVHEVLREFGESEECRDLTGEEEIAAKLRDYADRCEKKYYPNPTAAIRIQLDSVRNRILSFAKYESQHRSMGWRPERCEVDLTGSILHNDRMVDIKGRIDRIDYNPKTDSYCVIDYKTWDRIDKSDDKIFGTDTAYAEKEMNWPIFVIGKRTKRRWRSIQMAFYNLLFAANYPGKRLSDLKYAVLGITAENSGFYEGADNWLFSTEAALASATEMIHKAIDGIENHIFRPPSPNGEWDYDFASLFINGPEKDYSACSIAASRIEN